MLKVLAKVALVLTLACSLSFVWVALVNLTVSDDILETVISLTGAFYIGWKLGRLTADWVMS